MKRIVFGLVCLTLISGCFGLDEKVQQGEEVQLEYNVEYPEGHVNSGEQVPHPEFIMDILEDGNKEVVVLFFWTHGCFPCSEQWQEMVDHGIAAGEEVSGTAGPRYKDDIVLFSLDASGYEGRDSYDVYIPTGTETGVPLTTILFENDGEIHWASHYGKMDVDLLDIEISDLI